MIKVGITGGIGAGKSIISKVLKKLGFFVFDTDSEAKKLMNESEEVKSFLLKELGSESFVDGKINKLYIAGKIFNDNILRNKLNQIIHPLVIKKFIDDINDKGDEIVFIESAILFESGIDKIVDYTISITAPVDVRVNRVISRDNCESGKVYERINAQMSQEEKNNKSDFVIMNDESVPLLRQVESTLDAIKRENNLF